MVEGLLDPQKPFADRFEIEKEAGVGGMGIVYRAFDPTTERTVALKVLRKSEPAAVRRFAAEAAALDKLDHPAIVRYLAHGVSEEGEPYLAMEWIEGESLSMRLARVFADGTKLTVLEVAELGHRLASALAAAHALGIVHRDVKPSNVLLPFGRIEDPKLADFGIARADSSTHMTTAGVVMGTVGYMAPEQARGERGVDGRADLFSLGCLLFRCLTNKEVFEGSVAVNVLAKLLLHEPPRVSELRPDVPPDLDDLIARLLSKERDRRPPSAAHTEDALAEIAARLRHPTSMTMSRAALPAVVPSLGADSGTPRRWWNGPRAGWLAIVSAAFACGLAVRTLTPSPSAPAAARAPAAITIMNLAPSPACSPAAVGPYRQGLQALRDSAWTRAHHMFEQAADADPSCPEPQLRRVMTGDGYLPRPKVRDHLRRATALRDSLGARDRLVLDAWTMLVATDAPHEKEAFQLLEEATRRFPGDAELLALTSIAHLYTAQTSRELEVEVERMRAALEIDPAYADAWQIQARALSRLGRIDEELAATQRCLDIAPGASDCMGTRASAFRRLGQCDNLVEEARRWISWEPDEPTAYHVLAVGLAAKGAPRETVEEVLRLQYDQMPAAAREDTRKSDATRLAVWMGDFAGALKSAEQHERSVTGAVSQASSWRAVHALADVLLEVGQPARAASVIERARRRQAVWVRDDASILRYAYAEPLLLGEEVQSGQLTQSAWRERTALWDSANRTRLNPYARWVLSWGAAVGPHIDATEAMRQAPQSPSDDGPARAPSIRLQLDILEPYEGRLRLHAGDAAGALPLLTRAAQACQSIIYPFISVRSHLWLGQAKERLGDVAGACEAYGFVIDRWGRSKLPTLTAKEAKERSRALGCGHASIVQ